LTLMAGANPQTSHHEARQSMDKQIQCTTLGVDTVDFPACSSLVEAYDAAIAAGMVAQGTQGILQTKQSADSVSQIAKDPFDPMAGHKAQQKSLKRQSQFATGRATISAASAATLYGFMKAIPTHQDLFKQGENFIQNLPGDKINYGDSH